MFKTTNVLLAALTGAAVAGCASKPIELPPMPPAPEPTVVEAPAQAEAPSPPPAEPAAPAAPAEPALTKPAQVDGGPYRVSVASETTPQETEHWIKRLEAEGLRAQAEPTEVGGKSWQRVVVPGLRNGREARAMAAYINHQLGIHDAWVIPKQTPAPAAAPAAQEHPQN